MKISYQNPHSHIIALKFKDNSNTPTFHRLCSSMNKDTRDKNNAPYKPTTKNPSLEASFCATRSSDNMPNNMNGCFNVFVPSSRQMRIGPRELDFFLREMGVLSKKQSLKRFRPTSVRKKENIYLWYSTTLQAGWPILSSVSSVVRVSSTLRLPKRGQQKKNSSSPTELLRTHSRTREHRMYPTVVQ